MGRKGARKRSKSKELEENWKMRDPEKHFLAWTSLPSTEYTCLSPLSCSPPCFLFLSVNLIDSAYSLSEAKGKWVSSVTSSVQGAPSRFPTSTACHETVEDPRVLAADTNSEAEEVIVDSFRCALLSSPAPRKISPAPCFLYGRVWGKS